MSSFGIIYRLEISIRAWKHSCALGGIGTDNIAKWVIIWRVVISIQSFFIENPRNNCSTKLIPNDPISIKLVAEAPELISNTEA